MASFPEPSFPIEFAGGPAAAARLFQRGVPRSFVAPVPLYSNAVAGHWTLLGVVTAAGPETSFHFTAEAPPRKIIIDPQMTLLCVAE